MNKTEIEDSSSNGREELLVPSIAKMKTQAVLEVPPKRFYDCIVMGLDILFFASGQFPLCLDSLRFTFGLDKDQFLLLVLFLRRFP